MTVRSLDTLASIYFCGRSSSLIALFQTIVARARGIVSPSRSHGWHRDIGKTDASSRKWSHSAQLSTPDDYVGGELVLHGYQNEKPVKEIGSVIVFPSYL